MNNAHFSFAFTMQTARSVNCVFVSFQCAAENFHNRCMSHILHLCGHNNTNTSYCGLLR